MTLKFGDLVKIKRAGFYKNALGRVIAFTRIDNEYTVLLDYGCVRTMFEHELKYLPEPKKRK